MIETIAIAAFVLTGACAAVRLFAGPTLADRIVALDVLLIAVMSAIATHVAAGGDAALLVLCVVLAIVGFTATVSATRFIEHEHDRTVTEGAIPPLADAATGHDEVSRGGHR